MARMKKGWLWGERKKRGVREGKQLTSSGPDGPEVHRPPRLSASASGPEDRSLGHVV